MTFKERMIYRQIKAAILSKKDLNHFRGQKRYVLDLLEGFLFYYPETGKILHSDKGLIFRDRNTCWSLLPELKELLNQIIG
jgi:hypothetical protein